jgi:hypothetical protein
MPRVTEFGKILESKLCIFHDIMRQIREFGTKNQLKHSGKYKYNLVTAFLHTQCMCFLWFSQQAARVTETQCVLWEADTEFSIVFTRTLGCKQLSDSWFRSGEKRREAAEASRWCNLPLINRRRESSISIATGYGLDGPSSIPGRAGFLSSHSVHTGGGIKLPGAWIWPLISI